MKNELNITSTALEKGIDLAKDFLDKLIMPAVEETGLLIREKVTYWKFKNQVKILNKANAYCEKNGIEPKTVSLKLLCPLLENASLEEDEILQDKWAILLSNLVDSSQNIENHVFPYILGQISTNEYLFLEQVYISKLNRVDRLTKEIEKFIANKPKLEQELDNEIEAFDLKIKELEKKDNSHINRDLWDLKKQRRSLGHKKDSLKYREGRLSREINYSEIIPEDELRDFELSNLTRLGLVRAVQETTANSQTLEIPRHREDDFEEYVRVDVEIDIESSIEHILTELGELFIDACMEKGKTAPNNV